MQLRNMSRKKHREEATDTGRMRDTLRPNTQSLAHKCASVLVLTTNEKQEKLHSIVVLFAQIKKKKI